MSETRPPHPPHESAPGDLVAVDNPSCPVCGIRLVRTERVVLEREAGGAVEVNVCGGSCRALAQRQALYYASRAIRCDASA